VRKCSSCGGDNPLSDIVVVCQRCGARLAPAQPPEVPEATESVAPDSRRLRTEIRRTWLVYAAFVATCIAASAVLVIVVAPRWAQSTAPPVAEIAPLLARTAAFVVCPVLAIGALVAERRLLANPPVSPPFDRRPWIAARAAMIVVLGAAFVCLIYGLMLSCLSYSLSYYFYFLPLAVGLFVYAAWRMPVYTARLRELMYTEH
jgi:hypothetical protein